MSAASGAHATIGDDDVATVDAPPPPPVQEVRHPDAVMVYHCDFTDEHDTNFDSWPDGWTRRVGKFYPRYLPVGIREEPAAVGGKYLRIDLDGGAATVFSPPIMASSTFAYVLETKIKTVGLKRDVAYLSVTFYDGEKRPLETYYSHHHRDVASWEKVTLGPVTPTHPDIAVAVIGVHLRPEIQGLADLRGSAMFDDVWFARLPRMTLETNNPFNIYTDKDDCAITCRVSGILERDPMMTFELVDVGRKQLATKKNRLDGEVVAKKTSRASTFLGQRLRTGNADREGYAGNISWKPPIPDYGFYSVRVTMKGTTGLMQQRYVSLAIVHDQASPSGGEFGWSLPRGDDPLPMTTMSNLLNLVGVNWVKFPVWYSEKEADRADSIARFAEKLNRHQIEMIGMLDKPPPDVAPLFGEGEQLVAAGIFAEPELWHPILNPIMTRLSLKVRWWQLGGDNDTSFVGLPNLAEKIAEVKQHLGRFGQEMHLGVGWNWLSEEPSQQAPPWEFLFHTAQPPLTSHEVATYLDHQPPGRGVRCWMSLQPLSKHQYSVEDRARDLVGRMLAAKMGKADCVFVPDPFNDETGLMNADGSPGELLLPWRTTSLMISGTSYVGSITLPGGSNNYLYARGNEAVMVVWNDQPTTEVLYLGENIEQIDLWGRAKKPLRQGHRHVIEVTDLPTFITGVSLPISRMRMAFKFNRDQLASVFGRPQLASFHMENPFDQGVGGEIALVTPDVWETDPRTVRFKLAANEAVDEPFRVLLRPDASSGRQPVRIDFSLTADRTYEFSVYRSIEVGLVDVLVELSCWLNENGELVVEQHLENKTDEFVSFNCMLFAPNRRRVRRQVLNLPRGRNTQTYILPDGEELLGKSLWLRAEEIGGERVLNYRVRAEK